MTFAQLQAQTAALGFLPQVRDAEHFAGTANRALMRAGAMRPCMENVRIFHLPAQNLLQIPQTMVLQAPRIYEAQGAQKFALFADGEGILTFSAWKNGQWQTAHVQALHGAQVYGGGIFLDTTPISDDMPIRAEFLPQDRLTVSGFALYGADLPTTKSGKRDCATERVRYDLSTLLARFYAFEGLHTVTFRPGRVTVQADGRYDITYDEALPCDLHACGVRQTGTASIEIPTSLFGIFDLPCQVLPRLLSGAPEEEIDLSADLAVQLPLLCAAECFYEEDPEKSKFYLSLYEKATDGYRLPPLAVQPLAVRNTNGW